MADFVSFPLRCVIDIVPAGEGGAYARARAAKRDWLEAHDYRVMQVGAAALEADVAKVLDGLAEAIG
jgi:tRNA/rRNA methyltransferase